MSPATWHVLQHSGPIDREFAGALAEESPVVLWEPRRTLLPFLHKDPQLAQPSSRTLLQVCSFPALRGASHLPAAWLARTGRHLAARLSRVSNSPHASVLVCTTSLFAGVAEAWPGPVVYWMTDLMAQYASLSPRRVTALDRRLCRRASLVCPNSERLAAYLRTEAACPAERIAVLPNAARTESLLPAPAMCPAELPEVETTLPRPIAGVIGNLAENTDWVFLLRLMQLVPWLAWLFVGSTETPLSETAQARARAEVMRLGQTRFIGSQPHAALYRYARAVDVAVLPYRQREPTFSGSSTRFYEHLAACHPMLATAGVAELRSREPLLQLVHSPEHAAAALEALRRSNFDDGLRATRWRTSLDNTWRQRAATMRQALAARAS